MSESQTRSPYNSITLLEAFSGGVFGIAITLLVLEIRLPGGIDIEAPGRLADALLNLWPVYLAYSTSFISILIMWINHHAMFKLIRRVDRWLLILNGLLLMAITFFNFPTVITAEYLTKPDAKIAAVFYSGTLIVIAALFNAIWWYAGYHAHLLAENVDPAYVRGLARQYGIGGTFYVATLVIGIVDAPLGLASTLALAVFFALPFRALSRKSGSSPPR
jgi:uncharacterized membrane protein